MEPFEIERTEFSEEFVKGMRDRMLMSYYKYGAIVDAYPSKVNAIESLSVRIELYARGDPQKGIAPGNTEYLMDAANFAMIEFMYPRHPDAHFKATDDSGSPGRVASRTGQLDRRDNKEVGRGPNKSITAKFR